MSYQSLMSQREVVEGVWLDTMRGDVKVLLNTSNIEINRDNNIITTTKLDEHVDQHKIEIKSHVNPFINLTGTRSSLSSVTSFSILSLLYLPQPQNHKKILLHIIACYEIMCVSFPSSIYVFFFLPCCSILM